MTPEERKRLRQEFDGLIELLDFHVKYDGKLSMSHLDHATYRDKILDLIAALLRRLNEPE